MSSSMDPGSPRGGGPIEIVEPRRRRSRRDAGDRDGPQGPVGPQGPQGPSAPPAHGGGGGRSGCGMGCFMVLIALLFVAGFAAPVFFILGARPDGEPGLMETLREAFSPEGLEDMRRTFGLEGSVPTPSTPPAPAGSTTMEPSARPPAPASAPPTRGTDPKPPGRPVPTKP